MVRVVERPQTFHVQRLPDIRCACLVRFPYTVIYREARGVVQVLAVAHKRRQPGYWASRA
jgi:toxin ParE1/3/4